MSMLQTRSGGPLRERYVHSAVFYRGDEGILAEVLPFVREGLRRREPVRVALRAERLAVVADALGEDASGVDFVDMAEVSSNPARVIPEWRRFVAEQGNGTRVWGVGEPVWPGRRGAEVEEALMNEALFDMAFEAGAPMAMLCPYDVENLAPAVIEAARRVHPPRSHGVGEPGADALQAGREALRASLPAAPEEAAVWEFSAADLTGLRHMVARLARVAGVSRTAAEDLMLAAHELATNSVVHGGGWGTLRSWTEPGAFVLEVSDAGVIEDPLVGRDVLDDLAESGRGVWLANQLCDLVQVRSGERGTVVRMFTWL